MPVAFDCPCGSRWWSPPDVACSRCGPTVASTPDQIVWSVGRVPDTFVYLSAQIRDAARFAELAASGFDLFVDVAGAAPYFWRPNEKTIRSAGVRSLQIDGVEDMNTDLPDFAFNAVAAALEDA